MKLALVSLLTIFAIGCGSSTIKPDGGARVAKEGVASIWVTWVKDKGDKFDANVNIRNENSENEMIILLSDMTCSRGGTPGKIKHTFFNTGERTIDFSPGQVKSFNMVCDTVTKQQGDFSIDIKKVWSNPSRDHKTTGKVIAENINWKQSDQKK